MGEVLVDFCEYFLLFGLFDECFFDFFFNFFEGWCLLGVCLCDVCDEVSFVGDEYGFGGGFDFFLFVGPFLDVSEDVVAGESDGLCFLLGGGYCVCFVAVLGGYFFEFCEVFGFVFFDGVGEL